MRSVYLKIFPLPPPQPLHRGFRRAHPKSRRYLASAIRDELDAGHHTFTLSIITTPAEHHYFLEQYYSSSLGEYIRCFQDTSDVRAMPHVSQTPMRLLLCHIQHVVANLRRGIDGITQYVPGPKNNQLQAFPATGPEHFARLSLDAVPGGRGADTQVV